MKKKHYKRQLTYANTLLRQRQEQLEVRDTKISQLYADLDRNTAEHCREVNELRSQIADLVVPLSAKNNIIMDKNTEINRLGNLLREKSSAVDIAMRRLSQLYKDLEEGTAKHVQEIEILRRANDKAFEKGLKQGRNEGWNEGREHERKCRLEPMNCAHGGGAGSHPYLSASNTTGNLLEWAWSIIANAGDGNWDLNEKKVWRVAASKWRDEYHRQLKEDLDKVRERARGTIHWRSGAGR